MSGFFNAGVGTVHIDLSPALAGTLLAIIDLFGCLTGIVGPPIVGVITFNMTTVAQWNRVFYIIAASHVLSGFIFVAFGSAELQSWGKCDTNSASEVQSPEIVASEDGIILKTQSFACRLPPASVTTTETKELEKTTLENSDVYRIRI